MSAWDNNGGGWEGKQDSAWGTAAPVPAPVAQVSQNPEQPVVNDLNVGSRHNGEADGDKTIPTSASALHDAAPSPAAEQGANEEWAGHTRSKYDYETLGSRGGLDDFDGNARVYSWDGEQGDIGPEYPELEVDLFGPPDQRNFPVPADFVK